MVRRWRCATVPAYTFTLAGVSAPVAGWLAGSGAAPSLAVAGRAAQLSRLIDTLCQYYGPLHMNSFTRCSAEYRDRVVKNYRYF